VLHRKIRAVVDPATADIAVAVYDLDEIAGRLAAQADYDGLTALLAADLDPARLAPKPTVKAAISAAKPQASTETRAAKQPVKKTAPKAAKVAAIVRTRPGLSTGEAAKLAEVSERTARRVINGTPVLTDVSS
jgi:hypothetical protein